MSSAANSIKPAPFLVFEGLDGSGKSTLIELLAKDLKAEGYSYILTREPGGTPLAEDIRNLLLRTDAEPPVANTELLLYAASRAQHVAKVIRPALERSSWVLCDRFTASSVAFQCFARGLSRAAVDDLNRFAQDGIEPDLTILLDLTVAESRRRQMDRGAGNAKGNSTHAQPGDDANAHAEHADRMERESREFHERVRKGYLAQAKEQPGKWLVIDATAAPMEIRTQVLETLKERGWRKS